VNQRTDDWLGHEENPHHNLGDRHYSHLVLLQFGHDSMDAGDMAESDDFHRSEDIHTG